MALTDRKYLNTIQSNMKLKYEILSAINTELLSIIEFVYIFKVNGYNVFFTTNRDEVYCFGENKMGKLGLGHLNEVKEPVIVRELSGQRLLKIVEGQEFMAGITADGKVFTWGSGVHGELGNGKEEETLYTPISLVLEIDDFVVDLFCNNYLTILLTKSENIYWFGFKAYNSVKQLAPIMMTGAEGQKFLKISTGTEHIVAKDSNGSIYTWGNNTQGQLGIGTNDSSEELKAIELPNGVTVKKITNGWNHSLLLTTKGKVYSFGFNSCGQLGTGTTDNQNKPQLIVKYNHFIDVLGFENTSLAICVEGFVYIWGQTSAGNVLRPQRTEFKSFQAAIDVNSNPLFTYKPLKFNDLFERNNRIFNTIISAFNNEKYSDLKFKVNDKCVFVHKWFVAQSCQHFDTMFSNEWSECEDNEIEIKEHTYEGYYEFLRCLYTDSIDTKDIEVLVDFLDITNEYSEEELKLKCVQTIKPLIELSNVCTLYSASIKYESKDLKVYCFEFMVKCMDEVMTTEDYQQMDPIYAKQLFTEYVSYLNEINSQKN